MRAIPFVAVLILVSLLGSLPASAQAPYAVGDRLVPFQLEDQHEKVRALDKSAKLLLFSRDMNGGDLLREAIAELGAKGLTDLSAVYVADIHNMPSLIASLFAIPRMRDRPYPVLLDRDGSATARLPDVEDQATILELEGLTLRAIHHLDSVEAVKAQLGMAPEASKESDE
ncbi:MAG: FAD/FMN-containing dehydrogenase [bacterium]|nr:FAD/FMN-containing dehydrogenase [bacterium]MCP5069043.1 FAD/FMN-containing dehydrogenase [bacterium]